MLQQLFEQVKNRVAMPIISGVTDRRLNVPQDLLYRCPRCGGVVLMEDFVRSHRVCGECGYHSRLSAPERLSLTADPDSFVEYDAEMRSCNPLDFKGYPKKVEQLQKATGLRDAVVTGECTIKGQRCVIGVMDSRFMMASMGSVAGEKITRAFERALDRRLPVVLFTASGGARMQEGIISLMQMAKTAGAVSRHSAAGLLYITVLTDPTTGGVTASFASLGDIILAEPKVLVGFAGRRVIEATIKEKLPDDFQTAEFLLEHGFVDRIVSRHEMRRTLGHLIQMHAGKGEESLGE
ncbi:MAG: acetyl-CoA carboxylase carboxyltransferase subunit beta [Provencibacterium sp.]|nr:acetyl-CoA carboxylase carboxyltransferase subunit beta [Provencibacterium sp.]